MFNLLFFRFLESQIQYIRSAGESWSMRIGARACDDRDLQLFCASL